jgi:hypothetical protein
MQCCRKANSGAQPQNTLASDFVIAIRAAHQLQRPSRNVERIVRG